MASPSVEKSLARTVGKVDYNREQRYYEIICELLTGALPGVEPHAPGAQGEVGLFEHGSAWTFNRRGTSAAGDDAMIDEYVVDYEEYPAIGSGGITYLGSNLYVNTFSVNDYNTAIESGRMSMMGKTTFSKRDRMRYRFMMQLFGLRLDKRQFKRDFGCSIEVGLPVEMAFMRASGAFAVDNADELTLTPKGRYLMVVMMRQFFIGVNNLRDQARCAYGRGKGVDLRRMIISAFAYLVFAGLLVAAAVVDAKTLRIPNALVLGMLGLWVAWRLALGFGGMLVGTDFVTAFVAPAPFKGNFVRQRHNRIGCSRWRSFVRDGGLRSGYEETRHGRRRHQAARRGGLVPRPRARCRMLVCGVRGELGVRHRLAAHAVGRERSDHYRIGLSRLARFAFRPAYCHRRGGCADDLTRAKRAASLKSSCIGSTLPLVYKPALETDVSRIWSGSSVGRAAD